MKTVNKIGCLIFIAAVTQLHAQLTDLARIDYTLLPATESDFEFNRTRALFNYPFKLNKKEAYLFIGLDYSNINITYGDAIVPFDKEELNGFQLIDLNIGYTYKMNEKWRFGARFSPGVSSNLRATNLDMEDLVFSGDIVFIKDSKNDPSVEKPSRLILGVSYSQNRGFPFPLPFISYYKRFSENFSYNLGVPKTNLQYHISDAHRLKLYAQLDGFTSNIQEGTVINHERPERFNMSLILSGLQYEYHFQNRFEFYVKTAYVFYRRVELRDKRNREIFLIDDSNSFYLQTGLRVKI